MEVDGDAHLEATRQGVPRRGAVRGIAEDKDEIERVAWRQWAVRTGGVAGFVEREGTGEARSVRHVARPAVNAFQVLVPLR